MDRSQVFPLRSSPGAESGVRSRLCLPVVSGALFCYMAQTEWIRMCFCSHQWRKRTCGKDSCLRGLASEMDAVADLVPRPRKLYHRCFRSSLSERVPQNSLSWRPTCCSFPLLTVKRKGRNMWYACICKNLNFGKTEKIFYPEFGIISKCFLYVLFNKVN